jgi:hypothetical protein
LNEVALLEAWLPAFVLTTISELALAVPLLASGGSLPRRLGAVCLGQLATHPAVWFIWPLLGWSRPTYLLVAESFAVVIEMLVYRLVFERLPWSRALAASALANATSLVIGLLLR